MPVELHEALEQISQIRGQLASVEAFHGYRAASVAATGMVAVATAAAQHTLVPDPVAHPVQYVLLWVTAASLCFLAEGVQILHGYLKSSSAHQRATTRLVVGQLIPATTAGVVVSWTLSLRGPESVALLPGIWALLVSLGVFASRRHLPRTIGWVALYYLGCGAAILQYLHGPQALAPWVMGVTFGVGQLAAAMVLYWNLERNGPQEENR